MYNLSCDVSAFAPGGLDQMLAAADALRINRIELADFGAKPLQECSGGEVEDIRCALIDANKRIALLTSSLPLSDRAGWNELFRRAHLLHTESVRIPLGAEAPETGDAAEILRMADAWGIGAAFENDPASFFRDDGSMTAFLRALPGTAGVIFNPAGFVALQHHPFFHVFYGSRLKNRIRFLRLNDALYSTGEPMPLAGGNGEIKELISILLARSYEGSFSVTPYRGASVAAMAGTLEEYRSLLKAM